ncbi:MAG: outer membrane beta-barrel protein, partial [bacterium]
LLAVVSFPMSATAAFDLFAGPALSFKTKAEIEQTFIVSAAGQSESDTEKMDIGDDIEGTDFGGVLGAGVTFDLPKMVLFAEARWTYGFTKIDKADDSDIKNNAFGFMVGVGIPIVTGP